MPSLDDVRERIGALEAEIQSKDKVPLTGHIIMACHTLPYVCNLREASPESPTPQMEIQPGDNVTMPQGLHTPTGTDRTIEQWPVLAEPVQSPELLASVRHLNSPSTKSGSSRTSSVSASRSDTPGALRAFTARQQSQHPGSGSITPSRPPSPSPMQQQYFPPMPNGSAHKPDEPVPRSSSSAYKFRWVLQPRRGHSALNAGIRSLADRQMTLVAWPGDLRNHEGEPMESRCLTDEQRHALVDGLSNLAQGPTDDETPPEEGADAQNRVGIRCRPVWLDDKEASLHYEGFCKGYLWPLFHYMPLSEHQDKAAESAAWKAYQAVNLAFARQVAAVYQKGDLIWIQDYHLLLVPQMLKEMLPDCHVGLFLHSPFPSSEFFRCLPRREAVLTGMLGADLLCFQTYSYGRHFVSACIRVMGYESVGHGIEANGTVTAITHCPIGIDAVRTERDKSAPGVQPKMEALRRLYDGRKIIVGRDKLDPTKGVLPKLRAFEEFLRRFPEWRGKVVLVQVTTPSPTDSVHLAAKISEQVDHINATYGSLHYQPVHHYHQTIERDEYFALLSVASLAMITSVRDGMNTTSMEYTICQAGVDGGLNPLILSEFTGVTASMKSAVKVNPWDLGGVAIAIDQCLSMADSEKRQRHEQLYARIKSHSSAVWASTLVLQLLECMRGDQAAENVELLDEDVVIEQYSSADKRLLLFDYDGTLTPIVKDPAAAVPPPGLLDALASLCDDPRNIVYIISGRNGDFLQQHLGHIEKLGMSAEHGCFLREPGAHEWTDLTEDYDMGWMDDVEEIFKYYEARTLGAQVEKKVSSVTWHYRNADPEFGLFQAKECQALLESMQERLPIDVLVGKKNLEVRPAHTNKGEIVKRLLYSSPDVGFAFCAGDDKTDEDMFRALRLLSKSCSDHQQTTIAPPQSLALMPSMTGRAPSVKSARSRGSSIDGSELSPRPHRRRFSSTSGTNAPQGQSPPKLEPVRSELDPEAIFAVVIDVNETRKTLADKRVPQPADLIKVLQKLASVSSRG